MTVYKVIVITTRWQKMINTAHLFVVLLPLEVLGIIYGTVRLIMAKKYLSAFFLSLFVSLIAVAILYTIWCSALMVVGCEADFVFDDAIKGYVRAISFNLWDFFAIVNAAGIAYPVILVLYARRPSRKK